jgi:hypothetical protein
MPMAQLTASTVLENSASTPSPSDLNTRPSTGLDLHPDNVRKEPIEPGKCSFFVLADEAGKANDICGQDRSKLALQQF